MVEDIRRVMVCGQEVVLDTAKLHFSEGTLSEYLENEGGWIDYFGAKLAEAERQYAEMEMEIEREEDAYDRVFSKVFAVLKTTEKGSDKLIEAQTNVEPTVIAAKDKLLEVRSKGVELKYIVKSLYQHLRAWDKNHENAQNRGNTLRKELERLNKDRILEVDDIIKSV